MLIETTILDDGWKLDVHVRPNGKSLDRYWFSPLTGKKFRSRVEVALFKDILEEVGEANEMEAWEIFVERRGKRRVCCQKSSNKKKKIGTERRQRTIKEAKQSQANYSQNLHYDDTDKMRKKCATALVSIFDRFELKNKCQSPSSTNTYSMDDLLTLSGPKTVDEELCDDARKRTKSSDLSWYKKCESYMNSKDKKNDKTNDGKGEKGVPKKKCLEYKSERKMNNAMSHIGPNTGPSTSNSTTMPAIAESK